MAYNTNPFIRLMSSRDYYSNNTGFHPQLSVPVQPYSWLPEQPRPVKHTITTTTTRNWAHEPWLSTLARLFQAVGDEIIEHRYELFIIYLLWRNPFKPQ